MAKQRQHSVEIYIYKPKYIKQHDNMIIKERTVVNHTQLPYTKLEQSPGHNSLSFSRDN